MSKISQGDIEAKLRQIQTEVDDTATTAKPAGIALGTFVAAASLGLSYLLGSRKSKKMTTVVEVRREG